MWAKILTVINTLLLLTMLGLAGFGFQQYNIVQQQNILQAKQFAEQITGLKEFRTEILENPLFSADISLSDTLVFQDQKLMGYTQVSGYLTTEEKAVPEVEEPIQVAIIAFTNPTDETLVEFIQDQIEQETEFYQEEDSTYFMPIGCLVDETIENSSLQIETALYTQLADSTIDEPLNLRLLFNGKTQTDDICQGELTQLQIID